MANTVTVAVLTAAQANRILDVLEHAELDGQLDFSFSTHLSHEGQPSRVHPYRTQARAFTDALQRSELLAFIQRNDPDGAWTDARAEAEGSQPTPRHVAESLVERWVQNDPSIDLAAEYIQHLSAVRGEA